MIVLIKDRMLNKEQTEYLSESITDTYSSPEELAQHLDLGIEMLFYIEEGTFSRKDIQDVVFSIRVITNTLRKGK
ncbi:MAG: hypothetical protein WBG90_10920 [Saonia sp.]